MFAQDAFVQVRLKERKRYAKDKAVHLEQPQTVEKVR